MCFNYNSTIAHNDLTIKIGIMPDIGGVCNLDR